MRLLGVLTMIAVWIPSMPVECQTPSRVLVHGHRGARMRLPENTLPAFQYAIDAGADYIELDLWVSKDNVLVVSHDPVLKPPVCSGPKESALIRDLTLAELRQWDCGAKQNPGYPLQKTVPGTRLPSFDEVLGLAKRSGTFRFNIEIKISADHPEYAPEPGEYARMVLEAIRSHGLERRVLVQSFDFRPLVALRRLAPEIRISALTQRDTREFAAIAKEAGNAEIIAPEFHLVTPEKVAAAHRAGLQVVPWTVNAPADWEKLLEAGVDGIITDDPAEAIAFLKAKGRH